jgi:hypothetical protein
MRCAARVHIFGDATASDKAAGMCCSYSCLFAFAFDSANVLPKRSQSAACFRSGTSKSLCSSDTRALPLDIRLYARRCHQIEVYRTLIPPLCNYVSCLRPGLYSFCKGVRYNNLHVASKLSLRNSRLVHFVSMQSKSASAFQNPLLTIISEVPFVIAQIIICIHTSLTLTVNSMIWL